MINAIYFLVGIFLLKKGVRIKMNKGYVILSIFAFVMEVYLTAVKKNMNANVLKIDLSNTWPFFWGTKDVFVFNKIIKEIIVPNKNLQKVISMGGIEELRTIILAITDANAKQISANSNNIIPL